MLWGSELCSFMDEHFCKIIQVVSDHSVTDTSSCTMEAITSRYTSWWKDSSSLWRTYLPVAHKWQKKISDKCNSTFMTEERIFKAKWSWVVKSLRNLHQYQCIYRNKAHYFHINTTTLCHKSNLFFFFLISSKVKAQFLKIHLHKCC